MGNDLMLALRRAEAAGNGMLVHLAGGYHLITPFQTSCCWSINGEKPSAKLKDLCLLCTLCLRLEDGGLNISGLEACCPS